MPGQSITHTRRQLGRVENTAKAALAAPANEQLALKALAPGMLAHCEAYATADIAVRAAELSAKKEIRESLEALAPLKKIYEEARVAIAAKGGTVYAAATTFMTPDDFLHVAEDMEEELSRATGDDWAAGIVAILTPLIESATKERLEANDAQKALQRAQLARDQAEGAMRPVLVQFRRAVRATFDSSSKAHQELRDRRGHEVAAEETEETDAAVTANPGAGGNGAPIANQPTTNSVSNP
ncbi:MAG TPA: hypothetical protein VIV60_29580 [Polyangiaceae bacterium]